MLPREIKICCENWGTFHKYTIQKAESTIKQASRTPEEEGWAGLGFQIGALSLLKLS